MTTLRSEICQNIRTNTNVLLATVHLKTQIPSRTDSLSAVQLWLLHLVHNISGARESKNKVQNDTDGVDLAHKRNTVEKVWFLW